jgi:leucyl aminopeptidase (aminopeptidase T)
VADPRVERYASLRVDTCVDVQPGWEVVMISTPLARPLLEELARQIGRKGAYCQVPCPALAQEAGMSVGEFEDFNYGACLIDWDAERTRMQAVKDRVDGADEVYDGRELRNIRLRVEDGVVVEASADSEEAFLLELPDTDEGSRRLGELGFGCNPGITRHMKNTLFDEKIDGTVHLALGNGFEFLGGTNESNVHWDIVKDLRDGGRIYAAGDLILEDGAWRR